MTRPLKILLFVFIPIILMIGNLLAQNDGGMGTLSRLTIIRTFHPAQQKVRVWLYDTLWQNPKVIQWAEKNVDGFLLSNSAKPFADKHRELLPNCMVSADKYLSLWMSEFPEVKTYYADEPYTTMLQEQRDTVFAIQKKYADRLILSEIPPAFFEKLNDGKTKFVYSSYQTFWFRFIWNFYYPCSNQIESVKNLIQAYPNRVPFIWIHLLKNKNEYAELIKFARENNIGLYLYAGDSNITAEDLINYGDKFMSELNK
jgi:hypothetical protein